jgi:hypothetical protein
MMLKQRICVKGAVPAGMKNGRLQRPFLRMGQGCGTFTKGASDPSRATRRAAPGGWGEPSGTFRNAVRSDGTGGYQFGGVCTSAFGAFRQRVGCGELEQFKHMATAGALIFIDWHIVLPDF